MLFNSIEFAIFLPVVFVLHWYAARSLVSQNVLLLVSSYLFYAYWDYRLLPLLIFSTLLNYYTGLKVGTEATALGRRMWLGGSIFLNLVLLGIFKYYNFFAESFADAISAFGLRADIQTLNVILPVGISFYTFHGLSYVMDIHNRRVDPTRTNLLDFSVFVGFFPLLVAGPIERATHLLPQVQKNRRFDCTKAADGLRQILWGLFKKVAVADVAAEFVNVAFKESGHLSGSTLFLGAILFAVQIYADFSGYSDIALGTARLFGIELLRNFSFPYFSRDIAEFWRRWHISLTSWFRDYLYIPLGGSRGSRWMKVRNVFLVFVVSGLWHGANWTFVVWGLLNALYFLPLLLLGWNRNNLEIVAHDRVLPSIREFLSMMLTFLMTTLAWVFFRSEDMTHAMNYLSRIFSMSLLEKPDMPPSHVWLLAGMLFVVEWIGRNHSYAIENLGVSWSRPLRWGMYYAFAGMVLYFAGSEQQFIYFQF